MDRKLESGEGRDVASGFVAGVNALFGPTYGPLALIILVAWAMWAIKCSGPIGWVCGIGAWFGVYRLGATVGWGFAAAAFGVVIGYFLSCLKDPTTRCLVCKGKATKPDGHGNWHMCRWCGGKQRRRTGRKLIDAMAGGKDEG